MKDPWKGIQCVHVSPTRLTGTNGCPKPVSPANNFRWADPDITRGDLEDLMTKGVGRVSERCHN